MKKTPIDAYLIGIGSVLAVFLIAWVIINLENEPSIPEDNQPVIPSKNVNCLDLDLKAVNMTQVERESFCQTAPKECNLSVCKYLIQVSKLKEEISQVQNLEELGQKCDELVFVFLSMPDNMRFKMCKELKIPKECSSEFMGGFVCL